MSRRNFFLVEFKVTVDLTFLSIFMCSVASCQCLQKKWPVFGLCMKDVHILYLQN